MRPVAAVENRNATEGADRAAPWQAVTHLTREHWHEAEQWLVRKALAEFAHERLITPDSLGEGRYRVTGDDGSVTYEFEARVMALDHWLIAPHSLVRRPAREVAGGSPPSPGAVELILDLRRALGLGEDMIATYLEEITSTVAGAAFRLARSAPSAAELAKADFQTVESGMTEGHPCFVANTGRLGFGAHDHLSYAPEAARPVRLIWLAARRDHCTVSLGDGLDHAEFLRAELDSAVRRRFEERLHGLGLDPRDYHLIPVHPWQWWNRLSVTFAGEIAQGRLVCLGEGDDEYRAQQSVRTFFNTSAPHRHYVKTALSVLNMGFMRGLSTEYMTATPAINDWVAAVVSCDATLTERGFTVLRERAAIGYRHEQYTAATSKGSPYRKMLAALWRESPLPRLDRGERLMTMAALLHTDRSGASVAGALIAESGLAPRTWLRGYLEAYLTPLLHCFYAHDLVFMPHGENVILVVRDGAVCRVLIKDIAEEVAVLSSTAPLPAAVERIRAEVPEELKALSILTDVVDCFLRFMAAILDEEAVLGQEGFWEEVAACIAEYQRRHPHLADRFAARDLFAERFPLSCLNRLQLRDNRQMVDLDDPASALVFAGELTNPLAGYAPARDPHHDEVSR